jgi:hypothetical protein
MPPDRPFRLARLVTFAVAVAVLALGSAEPAAAAPTVKLLTPADGSTVLLKPGETITYRWLVIWPDAPKQGTVTTYWQLSSDRSFGSSQMVGIEGHSCSVQDYGCWTTWTPAQAYGPPYGKTFYWRVKFNGAVSAVGSFTVKLAPDLVRPRVRAYGGKARRGTTARFTARVADDRGAVRYRATLEWHGFPVLARSFPFGETAWTRPLGFWSKRRLPMSMRAGRYQFCVKAWDRAGNHARSCAPYRIR